MKLPFFGKSIASRYEEAAASLGPSGGADYADPITWAALRLAHEEVRQRYTKKITFRAGVEAGQRMWGNEAFRLVNDGYILGRIEAGSEGRALSFSGIATGDPAYEAGEFAMIASQSIDAGAEHGRFSGPPPSEISKLLTQFALDACGVLFEYVDDTKDNHTLLGEGSARAVNLGRELALMEDFYVNPKKRRELLEIREQAQGEELRRLELIGHELSESGIQTPSDWAMQMMRKVHQRIRMPQE